MRLCIKNALHSAWNMLGASKFLPAPSGTGSTVRKGFRVSDFLIHFTCRADKGFRRDFLISQFSH